MNYQVGDRVRVTMPNINSLVFLTRQGFDTMGAVDRGVIEIDEVSRPYDDMTGIKCYHGKVVEGDLSRAKRGLVCVHDGEIDGNA